MACNRDITRRWGVATGISHLDGFFFSEGIRRHGIGGEDEAVGRWDILEAVDMSCPPGDAMRGKRRVFEKGEGSYRSGADCRTMPEVIFLGP